ncbi:MAG: hypothetical protein R6V07_01960 [Armatimonadota bacterium]
MVGATLGHGGDSLDDGEEKAPSADGPKIEALFEQDEQGFAFQFRATGGAQPGCVGMLGVADRSTRSSKSAIRSATTTPSRSPRSKATYAAFICRWVR